MKAVIIDKANEIRICDLVIPRREKGEALIKVEQCGICGADVSAFKGTSPNVVYPVVIGHEMVGRILEIEENDRNLTLGDRVVVEPFCFCGECYICLQGRYNDCPHLYTRGVQIPGTMSEYITHKISLIHKIPDNMNCEQSVMVEPVTIALHGLHRVQLKAGETCLVIGAGTIGMLSALIAELNGAKVILVDPIEERLRLAQSMGIEDTFNNSTGDLLKYLKGSTDGWLPNVIVECSGAAVMIEKVTDYISYGGRIVFVGWPKAPVTFNTILVSRKEIDIFGSRNSKDCFPESIELISSGKLDVLKFISAVIPFEQISDMFRKLIEKPEKYIKAIVKM